MRTAVIQLVAAAALSLLSVGCATTTTSATSAHVARPDVSEAELETAVQEAERSALARMTESVDPETAQTARQLSLAEGH